MSSDPLSANFTNVETALLAEFAKVDASGLVQIVGGGLSMVWSAVLPIPITLAVVLQLGKPQGAVVTDTFRLEVLRPGGTPAIDLGGQLRVDTLSDTANVAFNLNFMLDAEGPWKVGVMFERSGVSCELTLTSELVEQDEA